MHARFLLSTLLAVRFAVGFAPLGKLLQQQNRRQEHHDMAEVVVLWAEAPEKKGFGANPAPPRAPSENAAKRASASDKYDEISAAGGQEYRIFVRQFGSSDSSWLPCGAIAVPRGAQVSDAIYANLDALKTAIVRTYPKLKGMEEEFEFGFNLKVYIDDPIEVAKRNAPRAQGLSLGNWINTLLSPIDASKVTRPKSQE
jgi:Family of unknown function (DUF6523)